MLFFSDEELVCSSYWVYAMTRARSERRVPLPVASTPKVTCPPLRNARLALMRRPVFKREHEPLHGFFSHTKVNARNAP